MGKGKVNADPEAVQDDGGSACLCAGIMSFIRSIKVTNDIIGDYKEEARKKKTISTMDLNHNICTLPNAMCPPPSGNVFEIINNFWCIFFFAWDKLIRTDLLTVTAHLVQPSATQAKWSPYSTVKNRTTVLPV